jgi:putative hydrolase of the HAD superfamily
MQPAAVPRMMTIQAVTFDVGGTLIEPYPSVGHVYAQVASEHGWNDLSPEVLNTRFRNAWSACSSFDYTHSAWAGLVDETFSGLMACQPSTSFFDRLYERFSEPDAWKVFDDVVPTLDALASRGVRLGIISNWDARLRGLLQRLQLIEYFDAVIISCEVGFTKPSPVIFEQAAIKLGLPPGAVLHVGDSRDHDVTGARAAGFHGLRIRRKHVPASDDLSVLDEVLAKIQVGD